MKRLIPMLLLCAVIVGGCGMGGTASRKGGMEIISSTVKVTYGQLTETETDPKGNTVTVSQPSTRPAEITAHGPRVEVINPDRLYYNWGILRLQKMLGHDQIAASTAEKPPTAELKESPQVDLEVRPDGTFIAHVGASKGAEAKGVAFPVSWLMWISAMVGSVLFIIVLVKGWPYIAAGFKAIYGLLADKFAWLPALTKEKK